MKKGVLFHWFSAVVLCLCTASASSAGLPQDYVLTQGYYSEEDDLDAIAEEEFGFGAQVADWEDIRARFSSSIEFFTNSVGLLGYDYPLGSAFCYRNGQGWYTSERHYYIARHTHVLPGYWGTPHDQIGNHFVSLGSSFGMNMRVLVKLPQYAEVDDDRYDVPGVCQGSPSPCYNDRYGDGYGDRPDSVCADVDWDCCDADDLDLHFREQHTPITIKRTHRAERPSSAVPKNKRLCGYSSFSSEGDPPQGWKIAFTFIIYLLPLAFLFLTKRRARL